jgi:hypothetical protein
MANDDMVQGYFDGLDDDRVEFPASLANRSACYVHGWLNGRDDRIHQPRATAAELRERAKLAEEADARA